jgi:phosphate transport system permease protein
MDSTDKKPAQRLDESRFTVSPWTLRVDTWMGRLISLGGISVVLAVLGMLVFLVLQVVPLFTGARVQDQPALNLPADALAFGEDEYGAMPFVCLADGSIQFLQAQNGAVVQTWKPELQGHRVTSVRAYSRQGLVLLGLDDGAVQVVKVTYRVAFSSQGERELSPLVKLEKTLTAGKLTTPVLEAWLVQASNGSLLLLKQQEGNRTVLTGTRLQERKGLGGRVTVIPGESWTVADGVSDIASILVPSTADTILVQRRSQEVLVYNYAENSDNFTLTQTFKPFAALKDVEIVSSSLIFGNVSAVFSNRQGAQEVWSLYPQKQPDGRSLRRWGLIHEGDVLPGQPRGIFATEGNKCYLAVAGDKLQIRNMTTGVLRWEGEAPQGKVQQVIFSSNYERFTALTGDGKLLRWKLEDHYPEASWSTFFGKIWYEGATEPAYTWQSSSGSDEFEAKFSLVPLFYGTIKGTFYALIFALPIALLSAIYVSQFLRPEIRNIVKPVMEIMASLPSVVLGFLAGLWLAPLVDTHLISIFCVILILAPLGLVVGGIWANLPQPWRRQVRPGTEFLWLLPILAIFVTAAWQLGPWVESVFFTVKEGQNGAAIVDFREWWRQVTSLGYDARNCLVVGFAMGFAVIPLIFTIAEDALSNVPQSLVSGSLALGASRWQTVWKVVLPTALSGIISAVMIGFGRAIGETMIVVMATGNTAIMEVNAFSGMRTLSANIAVELPEAPAGQTHYRTLFLGACCLFILTFVINTLAEMLRQRVRDRYKVV